MSEAELMAAMTEATQLVYLCSQWWLTITTALALAIFFAGKLIPRWLFGLILVLYALTVCSVFIEMSTYGLLAADYAARLAEIRSIHELETSADRALSSALSNVNAVINYVIMTGASIGTVAYCISIWSKARRERFEEG